MRGLLSGLLRFFGVAVILLIVAIIVFCLWEIFFRGKDDGFLRHADFGSECADLHDDLRDENGLPPPAHCVRVFYGTPRNVIGRPGGADFGYGKKFGDGLSKGYADVTLPLRTDEETDDGRAGVRARGEYELKPGAASRTAEDAVRYAAITTITRAGVEDEFFARLDDELYFYDSNALLVFVHGFNQSFDRAVLRTAQIAVDLTFDAADPFYQDRIGEPGAGLYQYGHPILFSWPNADRICSYCFDSWKARDAAPYLSTFLAELIEGAEVEEINLVVHSMGNRVFAEAIEQVTRDHLQDGGKIKRIRIVNAAADVGVGRFADAMERVEALYAENDPDRAPNVRIYATTKDRALNVSYLVNLLETRLGQLPFLPWQRKFEAPNDDRYRYIDAGSVNSDLYASGDWLNHSYVNGARNVIADMACFFEDQEGAVIRQTLSGRDDVWTYGSAGDDASNECEPKRSPNIFNDLEYAREQLSRANVSPAYRNDPGGFADAPAMEAPPVQYRDCWDGSSVPDSAECPPQLVEETDIDLDPLSFTVYFDYKKASLLPAAETLIREAARRALENDIDIVTVSGNTDTVGSDAYNQRLSARRAEAVRRALIAAGIPADRIRTEALGETNLAKPTADEVREPLNRRVEIVIAFE